VAWSVSDELRDEALAQAERDGLVQPHAVLKAASSRCPEETWDLHLISWIYPTGARSHEAGISVFHMKPLSTGRVRLRSRDPLEQPLVERGFLTREEDLATILEGVELARGLAAAPPLRELFREEVRPGAEDPEQYVRGTIRNYFHPAGTCALGAVVDEAGRVHGIEGLAVVDASLMPTIPRANTNLTTAAIAERLAAGFGD
jgi:choline dehydrogenase